MRNYRIAILGLALTMLGAFVGLWIGVRNKLIDPISIEVVNTNPATGMAQEGEKIEVLFSVQNRSEMPIVVREISGSCGCMNYKLGGCAFNADQPATINPLSSLPLELSIETSRTSGVKEYHVNVHCEDRESQSYLISSNIEFRILGHLRVEPSVVVLKNANAGKPETFELNLLDGQLEDGIEIDKLIVSSPDRIDVKLEKTEGGGIPMDDGRLLRRTVKVEYMPLESSSFTEDFIELIPVDDKFDAVRIPIHCYMQPKDYVVTPNPLFVESKTFPVTRTLLCQSHLENSGEFSVINKPDNISVEIERIDSSKVLIHMTILTMIADDSQLKVELGHPDDSNKRCVIDVRVPL